MKIVTEPKAKPGTSLGYFDVEASYGSLWIDFNDHERFRIAGDALSSHQKTFRQIKTASPVVEGDVLLHAVPDMISETLKIQCFGFFQSELEDNIALVEAVFEQFSYQVRVTKNEHREIWRCQMAQNITVEAGQAYSHAMMGVVTVTVPRYPTLVREAIIE